MLLSLYLIFYTNQKYQSQIIYNKPIDSTFIFNNTEINISEVNFYKPSSYSKLYKNIDFNDSALLYIVVDINLSNLTDEYQYIDLTQILLVQDNWSEYIFLNDLFTINNIDSYNIAIAPGSSGKLKLPYMYSKYFQAGNDINNVFQGHFDIYFRLGYPNLNENIVISLDKYKILK